MICVRRLHQDQREALDHGRFRLGSVFAQAKLDHAGDFGALDHAVAVEIVQAKGEA